MEFSFDHVKFEVSVRHQVESQLGHQSGWESWGEGMVWAEVAWVANAGTRKERA